MLPPMTLNTRLSSSSWRTTRQRVAPMAMRTAISCARAVERESIRLATLAQAISSTSTTAPITVRNMERPAPPMNRSVKVSTRTPRRSAVVSG